MKNAVILEKISANDETMLITEWLVKDGDYVNAGQLIAQVEASKAIMEIHSPLSGYLLKRYQAGDEVAVGNIIAEIVQEPTSAQNKEDHKASIFQEDSNNTTVRFSKTAIAYLAQRKIDPLKLGLSGLITLDHLKQHLVIEEQIQSPPTATVLTKPNESDKTLSLAENIITTEPIEVSKQAEIRILSEAQNGSLPSSVTVQFNSTRLREKLQNNANSSGQMFPYLLWILGITLQDWPQLLSYYEKQKIHRYNIVNIGIAIDMNQGLRVPVIRQINQLTLQNVETAVAYYVSRYHENKLSPEDVTGATFTVSDLSGQNVLHFQPMLNKRQCAILGIGGDKDLDGYPMSLTLAFDHRVLTGTIAARFLNDFKRRLLTSNTSQLHVSNTEEKQLVPIHSNFSPTNLKLADYISSVWQSQLECQTVNPSDNFFKLGGDSMKAVDTVSQITTRIAVAIPLRLLFENPTLHKFTQQIIQLINEVPRDVDNLPPVLSDSHTTLSLQQERLLKLCADGDPADYNLFRAYRLTGHLDKAALRHALYYLTKRHEILRSRFDWDTASFIGYFEEDSILPIEFIDLSAIAEEDQNEQLLSTLQCNSQCTWGVSGDWLFHVSLILLKADEHVLTICLHHLIADGGSIRILMDELSTCYAHMYGDKSVTLPKELQRQYRHYANQQRQHILDVSVKRQINYWKHKMEGAPSLLTLPMRNRPETYQTGSSASEIFQIPQEIGVLEFSRHTGTTLYTVLMSAWAIVLSHYSSQQEVVIGTAADNRQPEYGNSLGFFANNWAARISVEDTQEFALLIKSIRQLTLDAKDNIDWPFGMIADVLAPHEKHEVRPRVFQVMLIMLPNTKLTLHNVEVTPVDLATGRGREPFDGTVLDMALWISVEHENICAKLVYNVDLFQERTVKSIVRSFTEVLRKACSESSITLLKLKDTCEAIE
ncbi:condensation domain-containing protein [Photorhabdus sp. P32]|uniref:condensation domain-containing protein n=1 Tax=Photorhabdus sp. P32 TaxID=3117549 RepID=UPI00311B0040